MTLWTFLQSVLLAFNAFAILNEQRQGRGSRNTGPSFSAQLEQLCRQLWHQLCRLLCRQFGPLSPCLSLYHLVITQAIPFYDAQVVLRLS